MSPMLDRSVLRRWFHLPAFAVIAVAATVVILGDRAADTWMAWKRPPVPPEMMSLVGRAEHTGLEPDRIRFGIDIELSAKTEAAAETMIAQRTTQVVQQLLDLGVARTDIRVQSATVEGVEHALLDPLTGGDRGNHAAWTSYDASQEIAIESTRIQQTLDAYSALSMTPRPSISIDSPDCWLEEDAAVRRQVQEAAWADLRRQLDLVRARAGAAAKVVKVEPSDVELISSGWVCNNGQTAHATVGATVVLR